MGIKSIVWSVNSVNTQRSPWEKKYFCAPPHCVDSIMALSKWLGEFLYSVGCVAMKNLLCVKTVDYTKAIALVLIFLELTLSFYIELFSSGVV